MRSLANPSWNHVSARELLKPQQAIKRKKPHYRGSKSGLIGVVEAPWSKRKPWRAYLRHHGQFITIGYFATKEEAGTAYNRRAVKLFGRDAYCTGSKHSE